MAEIMYGIRENGNIVSIDDIAIGETGLLCKCKCPLCHRDLLACSLDGKVMRYFRHHVADHEFSGCSATHANESALHKMAKEIILEEKRIALPPMDAPISRFKLPFEQAVTIRLPQSVSLQTELMLEHIKAVELEKKYQGFRSDLCISANNQTYLVEIAVTHRVNLIKQRKVESCGIPMLEIDLRGYLTTGINRETLREIIVNELGSKKWISYPAELYNQACKTLMEQATIIHKQIEETKHKAQKEYEALQKKYEKEKEKLIANADYGQDECLIIVDGQQWRKCTACQSIKKEEEFIISGTPTRNNGLCKSCAKDWDNIVYHRTHGYKKRSTMI